MIYTYMHVPEPSVANREIGVGTLLLYICGKPPEGNGKIRIFPEKKK